MCNSPPYSLRSPLPLVRPLGPRRKSKDSIGRHVFFPNGSPSSSHVVRTAKGVSPAATARQHAQKRKDRRSSPSRENRQDERERTPALTYSYASTECPCPSSPASPNGRAVMEFSAAEARYDNGHSPGTELADYLGGWVGLEESDGYGQHCTPCNVPVDSSRKPVWTQPSNYVPPPFDSPSRPAKATKITSEKGPSTRSFSADFTSTFGVHDVRSTPLAPDLRSHVRYSPSDDQFTSPHGDTHSPSLVTPSDDHLPLPDCRPHLFRPHTECDYFSHGYSMKGPNSGRSTPHPPAQEYPSPETPNNALCLDLGTGQCATEDTTSAPSSIFASFLAPSLDARRVHPLPMFGFDPEFGQRYRLGDELGSGGFGFVMSAVQTGYGNVPGVEVAVKFIIKRRLAAGDMMEDRPSEAFILAMCKHPNIVAYLELFEDDEYFILVQELHGSPWATVHELPAAPSNTYNPVHDIPHPLTDIRVSLLVSTPLGCSALSANGEWPISKRSSWKHSSNLMVRPAMGRRPSHDLFEAVEHKRFNEEESRYVFRQIVEAVAYMHGLGVRHRDLKDENITIDKHLRVKIIDFGSAILEDKDEAIFHDTFRGTMAYAPAEILMGHTYQAAPADVWALGILLSIIVTGESPFPSIAWAMNGHIQLKRQAPRGVMEILSMCLTPNPRARPTVDAILLHPWLSGDRGSIS